MSSWSNEVETAMDSGIRDGSLPCNTDLFVQILLKLFISILQNGLPTEKVITVVVSNKLTNLSYKVLRNT